MHIWIFSIFSKSNRLNDGGAGKKIELQLGKIISAEVLSAKKEFTKNNNDKSDSKCNSWSLTPKQIEYIVKQFKPTTREERNLSYNYYPCRMTGEIRINNITLKFWLGGGGTLTLQNSDTTLYYGYEHHNPGSYFISGKLSQNELQQ